LWGNSRSLSFITIHQRLVQRINKDASLTNELKNAMNEYDTKVTQAHERVQRARSVLADVQSRIATLKAYFKQKRHDDTIAEREAQQHARERNAKAVLTALRVSVASHNISKFYRLKVLAPRAAEAQLKKLKARKK
jgi:hypothetical protein